MVDTFNAEVTAARAVPVVPVVRPPMLRSAFEVCTIYIVVAFLYAMVIPRLSL
jgi:hypothetical protein